MTFACRGRFMSKTSTDAAENIDRFQVRWVFGKISDALRQQLVAFWLREGALAHADEAWRRTSEVACVLLADEREDIAGVCTVAIHMDDHARSYGFVRIFIRAERRARSTAYIWRTKESPAGRSPSLTKLEK